MHIVYIHGNGATAQSFSYIRSKITGHQEILLEYDSRNGFYRNYEAMRARLENVDDIFFVAHSLGGIYALHLANDLASQVRGAVTLSTPYNGSEAAQLVKFILPFNQVLKDIQPTSRPIAEARNLKILHPWTNVVSLKGHSPFMASANDGVVTHKSMRQRDDMKIVEIDSNHYEILLSDKAVRIIQKAIDAVQKTSLPKRAFMEAGSALH